MRNIITLTILSLTITVTGCATNGEKSNLSDSLSSGAASVGSAMKSMFTYENGIYVSPEQLAKIKVGKSAAKDVVSIIGLPMEKKQLKNRELWSYAYTKSTALGQTNETTVVEFSSRGIVVAAYKAGGRDIPTGNALIDKANGVK